MEIHHLQLFWWFLPFLKRNMSKPNGRSPSPVQPCWVWNHRLPPPSLWKMANMQHERYTQYANTRRMSPWPCGEKPRGFRLKNVVHSACSAWGCKPAMAPPALQVWPIRGSHHTVELQGSLWEEGQDGCISNICLCKSQYYMYTFIKHIRVSFSASYTTRSLGIIFVFVVTPPRSTWTATARQGLPRQVEKGELLQETWNLWSLFRNFNDPLLFQYTFIYVGSKRAPLKAIHSKEITNNVKNNP